MAELVEPLEKPELLNRSVKTNFALAWWSGTRIRTPRITATPITCHQTETPLIRATRWLPVMFTRTWNARLMRNSQNVPDRKSPDTPLKRLKLKAPNVKFMNVAQP